MRTLGIIGGMSPESTAIYYNQINRQVNQHKGGNTSAPLLIVSVNFEEIVQCQKQGNWDKAGEILAEAGRKLEQIGAQAILIGANTMHKVAPQVQQAISVPLLHVLDITATTIKSQGITQVALLGTSFTMSDSFYRNGLLERGIIPLVPNERQQAEVHRVIFEELCLGKRLPQSKAFYLDVIAELQRQGAQGVILGCTEIGLLLNQQDSELPFFDTALLHAQMAAEFILEIES